MAEMTAQQVWESLGKPKLNDLEVMASDAQKSFFQATNVLVRNSQKALIESIFRVMEYVEQGLSMNAAKSLLAQVNENVKALKQVLGDNEAVKIGGDKTVKYGAGDNMIPVSDPTGSSPVARHTKAIENILSSVADTGHLTKDMYKALKSIANEAGKTQKRIAVVRENADAIARVIPADVNLTIKKGVAELEVTNLIHSAYLRRMREIESGKMTTFGK